MRHSGTPVLQGGEHVSGENLTIARGKLAINSPFWGTLLFAANLRPSEAIPTAATDGRDIFYNPAFTDPLGVPESLFVLVHEMMHIMLMHPWRLGNRNRKIANIAMDHVVHCLMDDIIPATLAMKAPVKIYKDRELFHRGGETWEGVYDILIKETGNLDDSFDLVLDGNGTEEQVRSMVARAVAAGTAPLGLRRIVDDIIHAKVPWQRLLLEFCATHCGPRTLRSWYRPNRRVHHPRLPSRHPDIRPSHLVIAIDASGSIDSDTLSTFAAEVKSCIRSVRPLLTTVMSFDTEVCTNQQFGPDDPILIEIRGDGGTDFATSIHEAIPLNPTAMIFLTDLCSRSFGPEPPFPVLWLRAGHYQVAPPFGKVVQME